MVVCLFGISSRSAQFVDNDAWFMNSGTSYHMLGKKEMFLSVSKIDSALHVKIGMRTIHAVKGVGTVLFQLESRGSLEVVEVLYVPKLKTNLFSVSALEDEGYDVFQKGQVFIHLELLRTQQ